MAKEFVVQVGPGNTGVGEKTTIASWESAVQSDLTDAQTRVYTHGGITGTIADAATVTGQNNGYQATVRICTTGQIMVFHDTAAETFEADEQVQVDGSNHVSVDSGDGGGDTVIAVAEGSNTSTTADNSLTLAGWGTDGTNRVIVRAAGGDEAVMPFDTSRYYITSATYNLRLDEFCDIQGIQLDCQTVSFGSAVNINASGGLTGLSGLVTLDSCLIKGDVGASTSAGGVSCGYAASGTLEVHLLNCVIFDFPNANCYGVFKKSPWTVRVSNCTIYNCETGLDGNAAYIIAKNCICECDFGFSIDQEATSTHNLFSAVPSTKIAAGVTYSTGATTSDGSGSGKLIDSGATFVTDGVVVNSIIKSGPGGAPSYTYVTAIDSETQLSVNVGVANSQAYSVFTNRYGSATFDDAAGADFHLDAADTNARAQATDLSGDTPPVTDDFDGDARAAWDVGADEGIVPPTELTVYVDPGGTGDYTSVQAAIDDDFGLASSDLVSLNRFVRVWSRCTNGGADEHLWCNRFTTDATHDIIFDVEVAYRHAGAVVTSGNVARLSETTDAPVVIQDDNVTVRNFSVDLLSTAGGWASCFYADSDSVLFENCVGLTTGAGIENYGFYVKMSGGSSIKFRNCSISMQSSAYHYGIYESATHTGTAIFHNCSISCNEMGYLARAGSGVTVRNCVIWADTTGSGTLAAGTTNNAFKTAAGLGSYSWVDYSAKTTTIVYRDVTTGDLRTFTDWVGQDGTNLYAHADLPVVADFVGTARPSSGAFYLGAHVPLEVSLIDWGRREGLGLYSKRNTAVGPFELRDDYVGWGLGQMFDPKRGGGI